MSEPDRIVVERDGSMHQLSASRMAARAERAEAEQDWPTIAPLKATADLVRWTMANADTLKAADAVVRHPAVRAALQALPGAEITAIREIEPDTETPRR